MLRKTKEMNMGNINYSIVQRPSAMGRGTVAGEVIIKIGKDCMVVSGQRIHGERLTVDVDCSSGKDAYPTYDAALKALRMKSANGQRNKRIYKCRECGYYHFTTNDGAARKPRPYDREREKEYTKMVIGPYVGQVGTVPSGGFNMKRFNNRQGRNMETMFV